MSVGSGLNALEIVKGICEDRIPMWGLFAFLDLFRGTVSESSISTGPALLVLLGVLDDDERRCDPRHNGGGIL